MKHVSPRAPDTYAHCRQWLFGLSDELLRESDESLIAMARALGAPIPWPIFLPVVGEPLNAQRRQETLQTVRHNRAAGSASMYRDMQAAYPSLPSNPTDAERDSVIRHLGARGSVSVYRDVQAADQSLPSKPGDEERDSIVMSHIIVLGSTAQFKSMRDADPSLPSEPGQADLNRAVAGHLNSKSTVTKKTTAWTEEYRTNEERYIPDSLMQFLDELLAQQQGIPANRREALRREALENPHKRDNAWPTGAAPKASVEKREWWQPVFKNSSFHSKRGQHKTEEVLGRIVDEWIASTTGKSFEHTYQEVRAILSWHRKSNLSKQSNRRADAAGGGAKSAKRAKWEDQKDHGEDGDDGEGDPGANGMPVQV